MVLTDNIFVFFSGQIDETDTEELIELEKVALILLQISAMLIIFI